VPQPPWRSTVVSTSTFVTGVSPCQRSLMKFDKSQHNQRSRSIYYLTYPSYISSSEGGKSPTVWFTGYKKRSQTHQFGRIRKRNETGQGRLPASSWTLLLHVDFAQPPLEQLVATATRYMFPLSRHSDVLSTCPAAVSYCCRGSSPASLRLALTLSVHFLNTATGTRCCCGNLGTCVPSVYRLDWTGGLRPSPSSLYHRLSSQFSQHPCRRTPSSSIALFAGSSLPACKARI
jgi:hypothetical protein